MATGVRLSMIAAISRIITPTMTPSVEIVEMTEMKSCRLCAIK